MTSQELMDQHCDALSQRVRTLEAALRKVDEWFYPGDSDLPHEVALMNEVHGLITPSDDSQA